MEKIELTVAELERETAFELPRRDTLAVGIGAGGLIGVGVAIDRSLNDVLDVNVEDNEICVSVAAVAAASGCNQ
jgi:hypothetical protein